MRNVLETDHGSRSFHEVISSVSRSRVSRDNAIVCDGDLGEATNDELTKLRW